MNKQDKRFSDMIAVYNLVEQLAAASPALVSKAHVQIEAEVRQQMAQATDAYNFTLSAPNAIHMRLEAAKAELAKAESNTRTHIETQHQQVQRLEERIAYQRSEAATLLQKDQLSERWLKLVVNNPVAYDAPQADSPMAALTILVEHLDQEMVKLRSLSESYGKMVGSLKSQRPFNAAVRVHQEVARANRIRFPR